MAPKAAEKAPAKKTPAKTAEGSKKKKKLNKAETYKVYIYKVLKQVRTQRQEREGKEESRDLNQFGSALAEALSLVRLGLAFSLLYAQQCLFRAAG